MTEAAYVKELKQNAPLPTRQYQGDAGFDLYYAGDEQLVIPPLSVRDVPCGVAIEWPPNVWSLMIGRSSTFRSKGIMVNPGIIDAGFRGELFAVCRNISEGPAVVTPGDRVAQVIPIPLLAPMFHLEWASELSDSDRGTNGFGSTGT